MAAKPDDTSQSTVSSTQDSSPRSSDSAKCCFSVKPRGYEVYIQMGHACNGSASIYIGKHTPTNHFVAIRQMPLEDCALDFEDLRHEIVMHRIFNCEFVLDYLATFINGDTLWIVMPLQGYGSCMDMVQAHFHHGLPELVIALILKQVLRALVYLHGCGMIHRSLRASHILVSDTGKVVVTGLRNCYILEKHGIIENKCWDFPTNSNKAISYYSPEVLKQDINGYDQRSDIYSLGVVACELANGHTPFANLKNYEILYEKLDGNMPRLLDATTTTFNPDMEDDTYSSKRFSSEFHNFAEICCNQDALERPSAQQLLKHPFFHQTKKISYEELPAMLHPLTPLTASALKNSENIGVMASLTHDMEGASVSDVSWDF